MKLATGFPGRMGIGQAVSCHQPGIADRTRGPAATYQSDARCTKVEILELNNEDGWNLMEIRAEDNS